MPDEILQPSAQWKDSGAFDKALRHLASLYSSNFKKCVPAVLPVTAERRCRWGPVSFRL